MNLTETQVAHYREHGYLAIPDFWTPREVAAMRADLERLVRDGKLRNVTTEGDGKTPSATRVNLQLCPMSPHSDLCRAMPFAPKVCEAVHWLIGDPVVLHLDQVFLKPPRHGAGTNWHQDNAYFGISDPLKGVALWTAIHDATVENGTLHVVPDVFHESFEHARDGDSDHHIRCYPPEEHAVALELPAGGVAFFAYGTPHCTRENRTDRERAGVALHFYNGDYEVRSGFSPERRVILTGPDATSGKREYGADLGGAWRAEVVRALEKGLE